MSKSLIVKSNKFIEASYQLTLLEAKVLIKVVSLIKKEDKAFFDYYIKASELIKEVGVGRNNYDDLKDACSRLKKKDLIIEESDGLLSISFFSSAKYYNKGLKKGMIRFRFDPALKPYLLQLKTKFTSYNLESALNLRSIYSFRIYELLKQYESIGKRTLSLTRFRYILGFSENNYKSYGDLKRRVILPAQKELEQKTDIRFRFEEVTEWRTVKEIIFYIETLNKQPELFDSLLFEEIKSITGLSDKKISNLISKHDESLIRLALTYTKERGKNKRAYFTSLFGDPDFGKEQIKKIKQEKKRVEIKKEKMLEEKKRDVIKAENEKKVAEYISKNADEYEKYIEDYKKKNEGIYYKLLKGLPEAHARIKIKKKILV